MPLLTDLMNASSSFKRKLKDFLNDPRAVLDMNTDNLANYFGNKAATTSGGQLGFVPSAGVSDPANWLGSGVIPGGFLGAIKVSHGSPHLFDKFDMSKIGTGEGAQAYGHGLYFGEGYDSPVARSYKLAGNDGHVDMKWVSKNGEILNDSDQELLNTFGPSIIDYKYPYDIENVVTGVRDYAGLKTENRLRNILETHYPDYKDANIGNFYNVDLRWPDATREATDPLGPQHFLDWDKPLSEQSPFVQEALAFAKQRFGLSDSDLGSFIAKQGERTPEGRSELLNSYGIPGIRYLDGNSRGAGQGTSNYVVFDDQIPEIVSRNGVALSDLMGR